MDGTHANQTLIFEELQRGTDPDEILRMLSTGMTAKEIAIDLDISRKTVEYHKLRIKHILNIGSTAELIQYAIRHGLAAD